MKDAALYATHGATFMLLLVLYLAIGIVLAALISIGELAMARRKGEPTDGATEEQRAWQAAVTVVAWPAVLVVLLAAVLFGLLLVVLNPIIRIIVGIDRKPRTRRPPR